LSLKTLSYEMSERLSTVLLRRNSALDMPYKLEMSILAEHGCPI
jgi:hypothetical protein